MTQLSVDVSARPRVEPVDHRRILESLPVHRPWYVITSCDGRSTTPRTRFEAGSSRRSHNAMNGEIRQPCAVFRRAIKGVDYPYSISGISLCLIDAFFLSTASVGAAVPAPRR